MGMTRFKFCSVNLLMLRYADSTQLVFVDGVTICAPEGSHFTDVAEALGESVSPQPRAGKAEVVLSRKVPKRRRVAA